MTDEATHDAAPDDDLESHGTMPSPKAPMRVARKVIEADYTDNDGDLTLRFWRGAFQQWTGSAWAEIEEASVKAALYRLLEHARYADVNDKSGEIVMRPWAPNRYKVADVAASLGAVGHTVSTITPPAWLPKRPGDVPAAELVAVANGLLHVPTRRLLPHTPRLFNTVAVPFDYDPGAAEPKRWLAFLDELWPNDPDAIVTLQEWFGYVVSGDTRLHKILFLIGPLRSGKGTIARVLTALIGRDNMTGPTLASLGTNFGLQDLIGKALAVIADARLARSSANVVVERLLSISGEDTLTIDRKYRDPWTGQLGTRIMVVSNELPSFGDASGAIASRFVVLLTAHSFLGKENPALTAELLDELPGILNWALDGLARLQAKGRFTEPASSRDTIVALKDLVSPVSAFVREVCAVDPRAEIAVDDLYRAWRDWCNDQGVEKVATAATFGKELRAAVPGVRRVRPELKDGSRMYVYVGITLAQQWQIARTCQDGEPSVLERPSEKPLLAVVGDAAE